MDIQNLDKSLLKQLYAAHKPLFDEVIQEHHATTLAPLSALDHESLPWNEPRVRDDMTVPWTLRMPEPRKLQLKWIYRTHEVSMNQYILKSLETRLFTDIRRELSRRGLVNGGDTE